jgi:hypothetical protein
MSGLVADQRTDKVLFVWLLLVGLFGSLIGVPYTVAGLMDPAAAHLPHVLTFGSANWNLLFPIVLFSMAASLTMGWIYVRYGLISAVVAHSAGDVVVYVMPRFAPVMS